MGNFFRNALDPGRLFSNQRSTPRDVFDPGGLFLHRTGGPSLAQPPAQNNLPKNSLGGKPTQSESVWGAWLKQQGAVKQAPQAQMPNASVAPPPRGMPMASGQGYRPGMQPYADGGKVKKRKKRVDERSKYVKKGCKK